MINIRFSRAEGEKAKVSTTRTVQAGLLMMFLKITVIQNLIVPCLFQFFCYKLENIIRMKKIVSRRKLKVSVSLAGTILLFRVLSWPQASL